MRYLCGPNWGHFELQLMMLAVSQYLKLFTLLAIVNLKSVSKLRCRSYKRSKYRFSLSLADYIGLPVVSPIGPRMVT